MVQGHYFLLLQGHYFLLLQSHYIFKLLGFIRDVVGQLKAPRKIRATSIDWCTAVQSKLTGPKVTFLQWKQHHKNR
jgi:hypothetical protein